MTQKIYPEALVLIDFVLSESDINKINCVLSDKKLKKITIDRINLVIGTYLAATRVYEKAGTPGELRRNLANLENTFSKLREQLSHLLPGDEASSLIFSSVGGLPSWLPEEEANILGLSFQMAHDYQNEGKGDCLRNLLDCALEDYGEGIDVTYIFDIVSCAQLAIRDSVQQISSNGGAPGDPYLDRFLLDLNKCYRSDGRPQATYTDEAIKFLEVTLGITVEQLGKLGLTVAATRLRHRFIDAERDRLKGRLRDAIRAQRRKKCLVFPNADGAAV